MRGSVFRNKVPKNKKTPKKAFLMVATNSQKNAKFGDVIHLNDCNCYDIILRAGLQGVSQVSLNGSFMCAAAYRWYHEFLITVTPRIIIRSRAKNVLHSKQVPFEEEPSIIG